MNAGKDVYCEKPMVQQLDDGQQVIEAQKRTGRILQVGSQRVSSIVYPEGARNCSQAGAIGELNMVEAWVDRNSAIGAWQYSIPPDASPANIDWDRFLGRAPKVPFEPVRLFRWRNYRDYGTGVAGDLFVHLFSGLHFVTGAIGPTRVYATGGLRFWKDGRDVPDVMLGALRLPGRGAPGLQPVAARQFRGRRHRNLRFPLRRQRRHHDHRRRRHALQTSRAKPNPATPSTPFPKPCRSSSSRSTARSIRRGPSSTPTRCGRRRRSSCRRKGYSDHLEHHRNFIAAVRSRKPVVEDAVFGFRAAGPGAAFQHQLLRRKPCLWDAEAMKLKA